MLATEVREQINKVGAEHRPFLFAVDFELQNGFFIVDPLEQSDVLFKVGDISNGVEAHGDELFLDALMPARDDYKRKFAIIRRGLMRGDSFLTNLTERIPVSCRDAAGNEVGGDKGLRRIYAESRAPYKLYLPNRFVCFSPEIFVRISGNRISTYPMKGTIDAALPNAENCLIADKKEQNEHYTIVDLLRNDLNRVAENVEVERFRYVDRIRTATGDILQTSSEIGGRLADDWQQCMGDIIFSLLPAGSVSGAPKEATLKLIREAEGQNRNYYTGVFGYYDGNRLDTAVLIRFIELCNGLYFYRSGGGVTVNSRAEAEFDEIREKIYIPQSLKRNL